MNCPHGVFSIYLSNSFTQMELRATKFIKAGERVTPYAEAAVTPKPAPK